jgi:hypothetical protein
LLICYCLISLSIHVSWQGAMGLVTQWSHTIAFVVHLLRPCDNSWSNHSSMWHGFRQCALWPYKTCLSICIVSIPVM